MNKINRVTNITFAVALAWSILAGLGIPMIVFGALYLTSMPALGIPLLVAGCLFTGGGVFAIPLFWVSFGEKRTMRRMVCAITEKGFASLSLLASYMHLSYAQVQNYLAVCVRRGYLTDYLVMGDEISPVDFTPPEEVVHHAECPSCGAKFDYRGEAGECPYCRTPYPTEA